MSRVPFFLGALLLVAPALAAADAGGWAATDVSGVAALGILAAVVWHRLAGHRGDLADRGRRPTLPELRVGAHVRHAMAYARAHAHLPHRRAR